MKKVMQLLALVAVVLLSTSTPTEASFCEGGGGGQCHIQCAGGGQMDLAVNVWQCCALFETCCNSNGTAYWGDPQDGFYCLGSG